MRIGVLGGLEYRDGARVWRTLDNLHKGKRVTQLVCYNAGGPNAEAAKWGVTHRVRVLILPLLKEFAAEELDLFVVFPGATDSGSLKNVLGNSKVEIVRVD